MSKPLELRPVRDSVQRTETSDLSEKELERRFQVGGLWPHVPPLTAEQKERYYSILEGRDTWRPQRALHYAWARVDPLHGHGGRYVHGRPRRPTDPDTGDGWTLAGFIEALVNDERECDRVILDHPRKTNSLYAWVNAMKAFGRMVDVERENRKNGMGVYYEKLRRLGYDGRQILNED